MLRGFNKKIVHFLDTFFYSDFQSNWDDKLLRECVLRHVTNDTVLLDIGAGRGILPEMNFKDRVKKVVGIDPVAEVVSNPFLHEGHVGLADEMPFFSDDLFDVIISDNVLEHVDNPKTFFKEVSRVLKSGGVFIAKTPNLYHYMPTIARITPTSFHKYLNKLRGRSEVDTFPTRYKCNTREAQSRFASLNNMKVVEMNFVEGRPEYLRSFFLLYPFGILYERLVNLLGIESLKIVILSVMKKD